MRGSEDVLVGVRRTNAVASLHLVGIRAWIAGQHSRVGAQADHLIAEPAVVDVVEQGLGGRDELAWLDRR